jgi:serine/threonine-protein kinase RsbW
MADLRLDVVPSPAAISALTERAAAFLTEAGADRRAAHHVALVLDELLTNLAMHGGSQEPASVRLSVQADRVEAELVDHGPCFDPRQRPPVEVAASLDDRPIGGLGLLLVHRVTDGLEHERIGDRNRTLFWIRREPSV